VTTALDSENQIGVSSANRNSENVSGVN